MLQIHQVCSYGIVECLFRLVTFLVFNLAQTELETKSLVLARRPRNNIIHRCGYHKSKLFSLTQFGSRAYEYEQPNRHDWSLAKHLYLYLYTEVCDHPLICSNPSPHVRRLGLEKISAQCPGLHETSLLFLRTRGKNMVWRLRGLFTRGKGVRVPFRGFRGKPSNLFHQKQRD